MVLVRDNSHHPCFCWICLLVVENWRIGTMHEEWKLQGQMGPTSIPIRDSEVHDRKLPGWTCTLSACSRMQVFERILPHRAIFTVTIVKMREEKNKQKRPLLGREKGSRCGLVIVRLCSVHCRRHFCTLSEFALSSSVHVVRLWSVVHSPQTAFSVCSPLQSSTMQGISTFSHKRWSDF